MSRHSNRRELIALSAWVCFLVSARAFGHGGEGHAGSARFASVGWTIWNWDPFVLTGLTSLTAVYARGWRMMHHGRTAVMPDSGGPVLRGHAAAFIAGMIVLFIALISPVSTMSEMLSWVHMIQHMMIMAVAAPLVMVGSPFYVSLWALPIEWRRRIGSLWSRMRRWRSPWYLLWQPLILWALYALTLWILHLPKLYEAALRSEFVHYGQHIAFFASACLFWRVVLDPIRRLRMARGVAVLYLFATSLHATLLGVFMTLSPNVWYREYEGRTRIWGLTALQDQQIAGLIMWMPACMIYVFVTAYVFIDWFRTREAGEYGTER